MIALILVSPNPSPNPNLNLNSNPNPNPNPNQAANLRHAPELIACIFHCAANAVKLPPQTPPLRPGSTALYLLPGSTMPYPPSDFLDSIVRPIYLFLRREVLP